MRVRTGSAVVACLLLAACAEETPDEQVSTETVAPASPSTTSDPSPSDSEQLDLPPVEDVVAAGSTEIRVPGEPDWLVLAGGSAWAATDGVTRLDGRTGQPMGTIRTDGFVCVGMDTGFGSVWATVCNNASSILRIDPATAEVLEAIPLPPGTQVNPESTLSAGEGAVWAVASDQKTILRLDPDTSVLSEAFSADAGATAVRAGMGALWVTNYDAGTLQRLDTRTGEVTATVPVGAGARFLTLGAGSVWVLNQLDGTVVRVDAATTRVVATVRVDEGFIDGGDITFGDGALWARVSDVLVSKIDPVSDQVVARYGPSSGSGGIAVDEDALWIAAHDVNSVWRLPAD